MARTNKKLDTTTAFVEHFVPEFGEVDLNEVPTESLEFSDGSTDWEPEETVADNLPELLAELGFDRKDEGNVPIVCNINGLNVSNDCKIQVNPNPKRAGSKAFERYAMYESAKTVGEYLNNGGLKADLRYDQQKGHLVVLQKVLDGHLVDVK